MKNVTQIFRSRWFTLGMFLLVLVAFAGGHAFAQNSEGRQYFPNTGHWVTDPFLEKYLSVPNPAELFGDPITDAFQDALYGFTVQYFEKVRFEYHPEAIPDLQVRISPLGSFIYRPGQPLPVTFNRSACEFYPNVSPGYYICFDFLTFFKENGGVSQFGYPISNFETQDGWIVQYFQNARFEWHPQNQEGQWVTVSDLGDRYFHIHNENPRRLSPSTQFSIPAQAPVDIKVRAFVSRPILPLSGLQTLNVIVQDQTNSPVENAEVSFILRIPGMDDQPLEMNPTNSRGISRIQFPVQMDRPAIIEILVTTHYDTFERHTRTSFQVWW
jgi:hypothetical protein